MGSTTFLETPIRHASDVIRLFEGSGCTSVGPRNAIREKLDITLMSAGRPVTLVNKGAVVGLLEPQSQTLNLLFEDGRATSADMVYPAQTTFAISGKASSVSGHFNPRFFSLTVGNGEARELTLYRATAATGRVTAGSVEGNVVTASGADRIAEPWALLTLVVTPTVGDPLTFVAQADAHGDFTIPVSHAPALDKDAPSPSYSSTLTIQRVPLETESGFPNPDAASALQIESLVTNDSFGPSITFDLVPGMKTTLVSAGEESLVVQ